MYVFPARAKNVNIWVVITLTVQEEAVTSLSSIASIRVQVLILSGLIVFFTIFPLSKQKPIESGIEL